MTSDELKRKFPDTYKSVFSAGITAEKQRALSWTALAEFAPGAVKEGILSGEKLEASKIADLGKNITSSKSDLASFEASVREKLGLTPSVDIVQVKTDPSNATMMQKSGHSAFMIGGRFFNTHYPKEKISGENQNEEFWDSVASKLKIELPSPRL